MIVGIHGSEVMNQPANPRSTHRVEAVHPKPEEAHKMPYSPAVKIVGACDLMFISGATASPLYHHHPHRDEEHIHPHSIISGTLYVEVPRGSGAIRFEDPRLPMMMAAPTRQPDAPDELRPFITVQPRAGLLLLWESWLRHEVLPGTGRGERLSISFNFA